MSNYAMLSAGDNNSIVVDRLVLKGKGILELCLEQGKNLCMKGFIDCQIEKGEGYVPVVEQMVSYIDRQLEDVDDRTRRALLLDLQSYAGEQLRLHTVESPPIPGTD
ncbi:MAG: hypothetical protein JWQ98_857 [Chlorobi bacterium]|nr:hypothetical protein [Chlorobiota bacterium]